MKNMKKMKKIIAVLLGISVMCAGLVGCSSGKKADKAAKSASAGDKATKAWKPSKTITIDVAFAPGGDTDYNARMYADKLGKIIGTSVIVTNVTGSGGATASGEVKGAKPDGYTVLFTHTSFFLNQVAGITNYGLEAFDFANIAGRSAGWAIVAPKNLGIKSLKEIVEKSKTERIVLGGSTGATGSMVGEQLNKLGAKFNVVDYGSATDKVAGLKSGDIQVTVVPILTAMPYVKSGDFIVLGLAEKERNKAFPDIPTCAEQGFNVAAPTYYFFAFPKGTPKEVIDTFNNACEQVYKSKEYQDKLIKSYSQTPFFQKGADGVKLLDDFAKSATEAFKK